MRNSRSHQRVGLTVLALAQLTAGLSLRVTLGPAPLLAVAKLRQGSTSRTVQFDNLNPLDRSPTVVQAGTSITARSVGRPSAPVGRTLEISGKCNKWDKDCKWWTFNLWCTDVETVRDVQSTKHLEADALNHVDVQGIFVPSGSTASVAVTFSSDGDTFVAPTDGSITIQSLRPEPGYFSDESSSPVTATDQKHAATVLAGNCSGQQMDVKGSPTIKASASNSSALGRSSMQLLMISPR
jgi:hypothetical protein